jgi:hypothetical protein
MQENIWNVIEVVYHKRRSFFLPESFNELSGRQLIGLAPLLYFESDELESRVKALRVLSGLGGIRWRLLRSDIIERALPFVEWLFDAPILTEQIFPCYKGFYGPASGFDNMKMKEFHMSEIYYRELINQDTDETKAAAALNNLVAVLYRKGKKGYDKKRDPSGDIRVEFNHNETAFYAKQVARFPMPVRQAIFLWYDGCRKELIDNNPKVFKEPSKHSFESEFDTGLYGIMRSLAGEKLGTVEYIQNMYVHTAMLEIGLIKEEEAYVEQQLKKPN